MNKLNLLLALFFSSTFWTANIYSQSGFVFEDVNKNGKKDLTEKGEIVNSKFIPLDE